MRCYTIILFIILINASAAFDFIRHSLRLINQTSDPCNDFYRHACPRSNYYQHWPTTVFDSIQREFFNNRAPRAWQNLRYLKALNDLDVAVLPEILYEHLVLLFHSTCEENFDTTAILGKIEGIIFKSASPNCQELTCLTPLSADSNCTRTALQLEERLTHNADQSIFYTRKFVADLQLRSQDALIDMNGISLLLGIDMRQGIANINKYLDDMMTIVFEWIDKTPWLEKYDLKEFTKEWILQVKLFDNFGKELENIVDWLMRLEQSYLDCMRGIQEGGELLCLLYADRTGPPTPLPRPHFFNIFQAYNSHPELAFGFPMLHVANNSNLAAQLGFTGFVVGHELSHSIIEDPQKLEFFPIFSEPAIQCVQNQYNATCYEYKEAYCETTDIQIDDNGADILGAQLAYQLFEDYFGEKMKEEYIQLNQINITYQQLFFYSAAFTFCSGQPSGRSGYHGSNNVRINALAQLPGFQDAFQCSPDSRIMKTVEKQCFIFGENAPAQR